MASFGLPCGFSDRQTMTNPKWFILRSSNPARMLKPRVGLFYCLRWAGSYVASQCYPFDRTGDIRGISGVYHCILNEQSPACLILFHRKDTSGEGDPSPKRSLNTYIILAFFSGLMAAALRKPWDTLRPCPLGHARPNVLCHARRAPGERAGALQSLVWQGLRCGSVWDHYW